MTISSTVLSLFKFIEEFFRVTWLSVSSTTFYSDLYKKYNGYGIKYITMAIAITSIIYTIFVYDAIATVKYYLAANVDEANPVEYILKQWPEVKYDGKEISLASEEPVLINTINGTVAMAIDPENKLSSQQRQIIPIILQKKQLVMNFVRPNDANAKPKEMSFGYSQFFSSEVFILNQATLKTALVEALQPIGFIALLITIPVLTLIRLVMHIASSLFSMAILFGILWWMKLAPTTKSVSRIVLFSSAAAEIIAPILLIFVHSFVALANFVEYWAVILAVYSLAGLNRGR